MDTSSSKVLFRQWQGFLDTPPLWVSSSYFPFPQFLPEEKIIPENLPELRVPANLVLGKRIERYFKFFIKNFSEEKVLAENIQIISNKITLGELDFILKNENTGKTSHIEVVYKFYLYEPDFKKEAERWIGPNRKDSLVKKISKLKNKQFPLLYRKETEPLLKRLNITLEEIEQKVLFKANLFVPFSMLENDFPLINNECIRGYWIRFPDFSESSFGNFQFLSPKKPDWPTDPKYNTQWVPFGKIIPEIQQLVQQEKSPLVWIKINATEFARIFIVWW